MQPKDEYSDEYPAPRALSYNRRRAVSIQEREERSKT